MRWVAGFIGLVILILCSLAVVVGFIAGWLWGAMRAGWDLSNSLSKWIARETA